MPMRAAPGCSFGKLLVNQPGSASFRYPTRITMPGIGGVPVRVCAKLLTKALPILTPNFSFCLRHPESQSEISERQYNFGLKPALTINLDFKGTQPGLVYELH